MKLHIRIALFTLMFFSATCAAMGQTTAKRTVQGIIVDETGAPMPFSNVYIKGTLTGVVSDFDGLFSISVPANTDSLWFNVMGYYTQSHALSALTDTGNVITMLPQTFAIGEVTVSPDDAPRRLMKQVIAHKKRNDPSRYNRTSFEKYSRWEYALNGISDKAQNNWILKDAQNLMRIDEDSNRYLPVYISETLSFNETQKQPGKMRSTIIADNTKGIDVFKQYEIGGFSTALDDGISFYDNVMRMLGTGFVSPIADNAFQYYKYYITDSTYTADSTKIYTVKFKHKNEGDKVFEGTMDIETKYFSLMRIDASMPKYTNINFVKRLNISSTYQLVNDSLPFYGTNSLEMHVDYMPVNSEKQRLEIKCNMFNSQRKVTLNQPEPLELSAKALSYETLKNDGYKNLDDDFWDANRHYQLTQTDIETANTIDSLNNVGSVKAFNNLAKLALTGFYDIGLVELGPYTEVFNANKIEGVHLGIGARTSKEISEKWMAMGVVGLGIKNLRPTLITKFGYKFDSPMRRCIELSYQNKLVKIGESENILYLYENMLTTSETNIVAQIFKREEIDELMYEQRLKLKYEHEWITGIASKLSVEATQQESPEYYPFTFGGQPVDRLRRAEVSVDTRFSFSEKFIDDGMQRVYMSTDYPVVHITLAGGMVDSENDKGPYARIHSTLKHTAFWGQTELQYAIEGGMIFGKMPYTMLELPRGNKTYGFYTYDFNMMNYLEFANDKYLYIYADYYLNGKILHHIPRMNRLGLREVVGFKAMIGSMSDKHLQMLDIPDKVTGADGGYLEVNVGIDNVLRFFRFDALWRITNQNDSGAPKFGIRAQFNFKL